MVILLREKPLWGLLDLLVVQLAASVIDPSEPVAVELPLARPLSSVAVNVVVVPAAGQLLAAARVMSPDFVGTWKLMFSGYL